MKEFDHIVFLFLFQEKDLLNHYFGSAFLGSATNEKHPKSELNGYLDLELNNNLNSLEQLELAP